MGAESFGGPKCLSFGLRPDLTPPSMTVDEDGDEGARDIMLRAADHFGYTVKV